MNYSIYINDTSYNTYRMSNDYRILTLIDDKLVSISLFSDKPFKLITINKKLIDKFKKKVYLNVSALALKDIGKIELTQEN